MRVQVTLEPWRYADGRLELRVRVDGREQYNYTHILIESEFQSLFHLVMQQAEAEIVQLVGRSGAR